MKITIPVQPVEMHITLQFFFVLLAGFVLGARGAFISICAYLAVGLCGFPIFATGGGLSYLLKPTFGFLGGFAAAGFLTGAVYERFGGAALWRFLAAAVWGLFADYACGMLYFYLCSNYVLHVPVGIGVVFVNCFLLTVFPDFILCVLAAVVARRLLPALRRIE